MAQKEIESAHTAPAIGVVAHHPFSWGSLTTRPLGYLFLGLILGICYILIYVFWENTSDAEC